MPNPYEAIPGPEVFLYGASVLIVSVAFLVIVSTWAFYSYRRMFGWYSSITDSFGRWESILLPPKDVAREIWWFCVVGSINALIIAVGLFVTGYFVHIT